MISKFNTSIILLLAALLVTSCVKEPSTLITNELFDVKVDGQPIEDTSFIADNNMKYSFQISQKNGVDIEEGKQVIIGVSDGFLATTSAPASLSNQITVGVSGGKAVFFYSPGRKAKDNAVITFGLEIQSQVISYKIKPSYPDTLIIAPISGTVNINQDLPVTTYLRKFGSSPSQISDDLIVEFIGEPLTSADEVRSITSPNSSLSKFDDATKTTAKINIVTNRRPGKLKIYSQIKDGHDQILMKSNEAIIDFQP